MVTAVVIDANAIARNLLTSVLNSGGLEVLGHANTSSAGMASMIKLQPQIVCIDIGTPDKGLECLNVLRHELPKALIFMVSGSIDSVTVQNAVQRGVHGFIVKPFNAQTVLSVIRNAVIKIAHQHKEKTNV